MDEKLVRKQLQQVLSGSETLLLGAQQAVDVCEALIARLQLGIHPRSDEITVIKEQCAKARAGMRPMQNTIEQLRRNLGIKAERH